MAVIARQAGTARFIAATLLGNKVKVLEAVTGPASSKTVILTESQEGPVADTEKLPVAWPEHSTEADPSWHKDNHSQSEECVCDIKTKGQAQLQC